MTFLLKYLSVLLGEFLHDRLLRGGALPHVPHLLLVMLVMMVMMVMLMVVRMLVMMIVSSAGEPSHMCRTSHSQGLFGLIRRMLPA